MGALLCLWLTSWPWAVLAVVAAPVSGFLAIRLFEELDRFVGGARAMLFFVMRRNLRDEIIALGEEAARAGAPIGAADPPRPTF